MIINGLKINYKIIGEGRPFLILHGWGSNFEKWQKVGELLVEKNLKVIIPDLPGFGESQKPTIAWNLDDYCNFVEEFVKILNLDKFFLLGHSFGGALAVKYSLKSPEKIAKLFLVGAACIRRKTFKKRFFYALSKIFPSSLFLRKFFYKFIIKSDYLSVEGVMKETYLKIIKEDLLDNLPQVQVSTVIIWGGKDDVIKLKDGQIINQKIKNSKLTVIPKGNHDLEQKIPEILTEKILENL
ncbi:MAG: hypothetical protein COT32_00460 [Candidatus Nealsonbacteria bacterium CG08_land_8_20_14_0_20_36_22]|uniref:AB hydrolase-1 domain-containing protein n=2 Tax=Candidatus Nealsoniibacteriota TaxID=1817911 RepID=A0A2H0YPF7_9BACT|nr:MAG: hypothetical protein COT32_00460 [Candidatus Nealsonbacteria bacterium CG08_land_8_20_14_0_20_36_22]